MALALLLLAAPAASASSEAGWDCVADDTEAGWTVLASGGSSIPMPPSVPPEGPKVITGWQVRVGPGLGPLPQRLEVFEIQNEESEFEKIGESATETLVAGVNSFSTRIPVDEGDSVGLRGPAGTLVCREAGAISWLLEGSAALGEVRTFEGALGVGTPLVVDVEDDRDGDGHGDETQDACPFDAGAQEGCPKLTLGVVKVTVRPFLIVVKIPLSSQARVAVSGRVELPSQDGDRATVRLAAGPARTTGPEPAAVIRMKLPGALRRTLRDLDPDEALKARLTVRARDAAKQVRKRKLVLRLKGQGHG